MRKLLLISLCILAAAAFARGPFYYAGTGFSAVPARINFDAAPIDLGDNNDYDGGGWGGGGWDDGWSGGGGDDWGDWGGGSGDLGPVGTVFLLCFCAVFFGFVFFMVYRNNRVKKDKSGGAAMQQAAPPVRDRTAEIAAEVMKSDRNFSADKFIAWVREVFFTLQYAWMEKDVEKLRIFEKEELFQQHQMQIQQYVRNRRVNVLDRINVKQAYLQKYVRDKEYEHISVFLQVRMIDYIKDEQTGQVLKGSPSVDCHMKYLYTFSRKFGVKSTDGLYKTRSTDCPNCGAPTTISSSGKCGYCGSLITTGEFNWVLSDIIHVKAGTVIDDSGIIIYE